MLRDIYKLSEEELEQKLELLEEVYYNACESQRPKWIPAGLLIIEGLGLSPYYFTKECGNCQSFERDKKEILRSFLMFETSSRRLDRVGPELAELITGLEARGYSSKIPQFTNEIVRYFTHQSGEFKAVRSYQNHWKEVLSNKNFTTGYKHLAEELLAMFNRSKP